MDDIRLSGCDENLLLASREGVEFMMGIDEAGRAIGALAASIATLLKSVCSDTVPDYEAYTDDDAVGVDYCPPATSSQRDRLMRDCNEAEWSWNGCADQMYVCLDHGGCSTSVTLWTATACSSCCYSDKAQHTTSPTSSPTPKVPVPTTSAPTATMLPTPTSYDDSWLTTGMNVAVFGQLTNDVLNTSSFDVYNDSKARCVAIPDPYFRRPRRRHRRARGHPGRGPRA